MNKPMSKDGMKTGVKQKLNVSCRRIIAVNGPDIFEDSPNYHNVYTTGRNNSPKDYGFFFLKKLFKSFSASFFNASPTFFLTSSSAFSFNG